MKILCKLGLHKWSKRRFITNFRSNVRDYSKKCLRCGKIKRWIEVIKK